MLERRKSIENEQANKSLCPFSLLLTMDDVFSCFKFVPWPCCYSGLWPGAVSEINPFFSTLLYVWVFVTAAGTSLDQEGSSLCLFCNLLSSVLGYCCSRSAGFFFTLELQHSPAWKTVCTSAGQHISQPAEPHRPASLWILFSGELWLTQDSLI